ncbi:MAG: DHA2 family efflux MFS transporter permease subunit [Roseiflexaceae bacterium]
MSSSEALSGATQLATARPAPPPATEDRGWGGIAYKWLVLIAVVFGLFMVVLDSTVVNIALTKLQAVFGATLTGVQWVVTSYTLALTVSIPLFGYLADRYGTKRIYLLSLALFTVASALCGLSWNIGSLVFARVLQGLGGGALLPLASAQLFAAFPPNERGRAGAYLGVPVLFAPALGPTLGGYIVEYLDWRLIFYLNVPIGIVGVLIGATVLREYRAAATRRMDWSGLILSSIGFATLVYGIGEAGADGWGSTKVLSFLAIGLISLLAMVVVELRAAAPLLDVRLFRDWNFAAGNLMTWTLQIALFGALFLLPIFLQGLRGLTPVQAGLWLLPSALATMVVLPIGGILVDRFGAKPIILIGAAALALTSYALSHLTLQTTFWTLQLWLLGRSVAISFTLQPTQVVALGRLPREALARATGLFSVTRQVVVAFGTALLSTYVQNREPLHFAHLAERVTASSPASLLVGQITGFFQSRGVDSLDARGLALRVLAGQLQLQAAILAFRDAFILTTAIVAVGACIALFLRPVAKQARGQAASAIME